MLLIVSLVCFASGIFLIHDARKSLRRGMVWVEDDHDLYRKRDPIRFRLSLLLEFASGFGMVVFAVIAAVVYVRGLSR